MTSAVERIITARWDEPDTVWVDRYVATGGYRALKKALKMTPPVVIEAALADSVVFIAPPPNLGDRSAVTRRLQPS